MITGAADQERTEFGFQATQCACRECTRLCEHISGALIPADLERWRIHFGAKETRELDRLLLASPGYLVRTKTMNYCRVGTLVPDRSGFKGACTFLSQDKRCTIHAVAPFSCRFFDEHMSAEISSERSMKALYAIAQDWSEQGQYSRLWLHLHEAGRIAVAPEVLRDRIKKERSQSQLKLGEAR